MKQSVEMRMRMAAWMFTNGRSYPSCVALRDLVSYLSRWSKVSAKYEKKMKSDVIIVAFLCVCLCFFCFCFCLFVCGCVVLIWMVLLFSGGCIFTWSCSIQALSHRVSPQARCLASGLCAWSCTHAGTPSLWRSQTQGAAAQCTPSPGCPGCCCSGSRVAHTLTQDTSALGMSQLLQTAKKNRFKFHWKFDNVLLYNKELSFALL